MPPYAGSPGASCNREALLDSRGIEHAKRVMALAAIGLTLLPFLLVGQLPLIDLPNHVARLVIREDLRAGGPLSAFYEWQWSLMPNLAIDLLSVPFSGLIDPEFVVTALVVLSVASLYGGAIAIDRTLNGARWGMSILTGVIMFHGALRYGFINYVIGLAVAVPLFAAWLRWRGRLGIGGVLAFAAAGSVVMLMHMFAFGLYALCVAGYELGLLLRERPLRVLDPGRRLSLAGVAATLLVPASMALIGPASDAAAIILWSTPRFKLEAILAPIYFSQPYVEIALLAAIVLLFLTGVWSRTIDFSNIMVPTIAVLLFALLVMPRTLFGSTFADYRLLCGAGFFLIGGVRIAPRSRRVGYIVAGCGSALLLVRVGSVGFEWQAAQPFLQEYGTVFSTLPEGSRVLVRRPSPPSVAVDRRTALESIATLPGARSKVFVGHTFTLLAQPLRLQPEYEDYRHLSPDLEPPLPLASYDYLLSMNGYRPPAGDLGCVKEVSSGMTFVLYRIDVGCAEYRQLP